jgi:hypothetical protein
VNLVGHREMPADMFFDEPQSRARVHIGFAPPRLWITSGLPTILELASPITTCAFKGSNERLSRADGCEDEVSPTPLQLKELPLHQRATVSSSL